MSFPINDDCMLLICDYLDLKDIFTLAFVSKEFRNFVKRLFERRPTLVGDYWRKEENQFHIPKIVEYFWEIDGEGCCYDFELLKNKAALEKIQFEGVRELVIKSGNGCYDTTGTDEIEKIIVDSFPKLKKLLLERSFTGKYLGNINNSFEILHYVQMLPYEILNIITLGKFEFFRSLGFSVICQPPTCRLNPQSIDWEDNMKFTSSQPLMTMKYPRADKHFEPIYAAALRIHTSCKKRIWFRPILRLMFNHHFGTIEKINEIKPQFFRELRWLYFLNAPNNQYQKKLLNLISECQYLEILDISGSAFNLDFIKSVARIFERQKERSDLRLCCNNTNITDKDLDNLRLSMHSKVSVVKEYNSDYAKCRCTEDLK